MRLLNNGQRNDGKLKTQKVAFRGRLGPNEMFPAGRPEYRASYVTLRSGLTIRAVESGNPAGTPILLVPGWGCSVYAYRFTMPALADAGFRVLGVDLKGHGLSDKPTAREEYVIDSLVQHLLDIIDALGLERTHLIGHSMGGSLLCHFAARHPGRARSLGLLSPVGLRGVRMVRLYRALTPRVITPLIRAFRPRLPVKIALARVYGDRGTYTGEDVEQYWAPIRLPGATVALRELLHSYDWHALKHRRLDPVSVPAIAIWGSKDHLMPDDEIPAYRALFSKIELHEIAGAGHVAPEETPDEVNERLVRFMLAH